MNRGFVMERKEKGHLTLGHTVDIDFKKIKNKTWIIRLPVKAQLLEASENAV